MLTPWDFVADLMNPALAFLPRALLVSLIAAIVCGVVGTHVVLRGLAFIGDAVSHAVFPGIAVAFLLQGSLLLGGAIAGLTVACLTAVLTQKRLVKADAVIGVLFAAAFSLGLIIISQVPGYTGSLQAVLFGSITGIPASQVAWSAGLGCFLIAILVVLHRQLVAVSLDREFAAAAGYRLLLNDLLLYCTVTVAVVLSVHTIGNILVLALLIAPAAAARLWTDNINVMLLLAPAFGAGAALVGVYFAWALNWPVGATIVLVATAFFAASWAVALLKRKES